MTMNKNEALRVLIGKGGVVLLIALFGLSCTASSKLSDPQTISLPIEHIHGTKYSCFADCLNMVLGYYKVPDGKRFSTVTSLRILDLDSLLSGMEFTREEQAYELRGFVMQKDESFLQEQLLKQRPLILIFKANSQYYHSVVMAGRSGDAQSFLIFDPSNKREHWMSRKKLMKRWKSGENTLVLVAPEKK